MTVWSRVDPLLLALGLQVPAELLALGLLAVAGVALVELHPVRVGRGVLAPLVGADVLGHDGSSTCVQQHPLWVYF